MPDLATLERIGFRGIPRWWRTKPLKPRAVGYRSGYMSDRAPRSHRDRSITSSDESNEEMNDSRSEDDNWNAGNGESDAQTIYSPTKSDTPPGDAVKQIITSPVRASGTISAMDDLIDLSINTLPPPQKRTSSRKTNACINRRTLPKSTSNQRNTDITEIERRTSSSSHSRSAGSSSIKSRHEKRPPSRSRTPASHRGKSDEEELPLSFDPGPIASPSRYRWDDSHDAGSISSDRERRAKDRNTGASAMGSRHAHT